MDLTLPRDGSGSARRIATAAAGVGGGLTLVGGAAWVVLKAEAAVARRLIGVNEDPVPDATGWYGRKRPGPALKIAMLGDSSAAGYGVGVVEETPGALLGASVSEHSHRRVYVREYCAVGAESADLGDQVDRALMMRPSVAVVLIGANDVTHAKLPGSAVRDLGDAVRRLGAVGTPVIVGTCPDLGTIQPIPQPLRQVAKVWSRQLAEAQAVSVAEAGGRSVSLGSMLGPLFAEEPQVLFGPDQFHPSAAGYARMAEALLPSVLAVLGFEDPDDATGERTHTGGMPLAEAAAAAARTPGTELDGTDETRGGLARLVLRRRRPAAPAEKPALEAPTDSLV